MRINLKSKVAAGIIVSLVVLGGGAALAASQALSPKEASQAIVNDAAAELGVEPSALSDALKQALQNQVDAAVEAGRMTEEQGKALKKRIESQETPFIFGGHQGFGHHGFGHMKTLDDATSYLGLTSEELRDELAAGKTLAEVAKANGKSVGGLVAALMDSAEKRIAEAVGAGKLTQAEADEKLADLETLITARVNGEGKGKRFGSGEGFRPGFGAGHGFLPGAGPGAFLPAPPVTSGDQA